MSMTFAQLRQAFETYTNTSAEVDNAQLALWMNEALLDLAPEMGPVLSTELSVTEGETVPADPAWLRLLDCELPYRRLADGSLLFEQGGSGRLWFRAMPEPFSGADEEQVSELHPALHWLPALFAASRYWDSECDGDSSESALAAKWLGFYYQGKNLARARLHCAAEADIEGWQLEQ